MREVPSAETLSPSRLCVLARIHTTPRSRGLPPIAGSSISLSLLVTLWLLRRLVTGRWDKNPSVVRRYGHTASGVLYYALRFGYESHETSR